MTRIDHPDVASAALDVFAALAEEFCALVEGHDQLEPEGFRHRLHSLVPQLYAAALQLPLTDVLFDDTEDDEEPEDEEAYKPPPPDPDRLPADAWWSLHNALAALFGDKTYYREVFDPYEPAATNPEVHGSLADDIADIYRDLYVGLLKWRRGESGGALWEWRFHFEAHWGEHATSLVRALHAWAAWHEGGWPMPPDLERSLTER